MINYPCRDEAPLLKSEVLTIMEGALLERFSDVYPLLIENLRTYLTQYSDTLCKTEVHALRACYETIRHYRVGYPIVGWDIPSCNSCFQTTTIEVTSSKPLKNVIPPLC